MPLKSDVVISVYIYQICGAKWDFPHSVETARGHRVYLGAPMARADSHCFGSSDSPPGPAATMEPDDQRVAPRARPRAHTLSGAGPV